MDLIILLVSVASLSANVYFVKKMSDWFKNFEPVQVSNNIVDCCASEMDRVLEDQLVQIPSKAEDTGAWRNATGLPAVGPPSVSPSMPAPKSGPLERPYGFPS